MKEALHALVRKHAQVILDELKVEEAEQAQRRSRTWTRTPLSRKRKRAR